jgi:hypothetical protein
VLKSQEIKPDGDEMKALQEARADVEKVLRAGCPNSKPTIRDELALVHSITSSARPSCSPRHISSTE